MEVEQKRVLFLGPPGVGKGTQAKLVVKRLSLPHISTGDILRDEVKAQSELGLKVQSYLDAGQLVPDEVIIEVMTQRVQQADCANGFILDGCVRTIAQAEAITEMLDKIGKPLTHVLDFYAEDDELVRRIVERGKTSGRSDDSPEVVADRLKVYYNQTAPVSEFYKSKGVLVSIEGVGEVDAIHEVVMKALA